MKSKILVVRKMSSLEYYYQGKHKSRDMKEGHDEQGENVRRVLGELEKNNFAYDVVTRDELSEARVNKYDFVFSLGGDGTVIATAAFNKDKPQLNIRTDQRSKGVICHADIDKTLVSFANGDYEIKEWTRQDVYINKKLVGRALNETTIQEGTNIAKMAKCRINGVYHENSGIVIATGTGSTGWSKVFEPYAKDSKIFKYVVSLVSEGPVAGSGEFFKIKYLGHEGQIAIDTIGYPLPRDSRLEIKLSKNPLRVIETK